MKKNYFKAVLLLITAYLSCSGEDTLRKNIIRESLSKVCFLMPEDSEGRAREPGSGFIVGPGLIATTLDLVEGSHVIHCKIAGQRTRHKVSGYIADEEVRIALLKTDPVISLDKLNLGDDGKVLTGDEIISLSCPKGLNGEYRYGAINGIYSDREGKIFSMTADLRPNMRGGPVLDSHGMVVGVADFISYRGKTQSIVLPSYSIKNLLQKFDNSKFHSLGRQNKNIYKKTNFNLGDNAVQIKRLKLSVNFWENSITPFFTVSNNLNEPVTSLDILLIVFEEGEIFASEEFSLKSSVPIRPGIPKVIEGPKLSSAMHTAFGYSKKIGAGEKKVGLIVPKQKTEIRVLKIN